MDKYEQVKRIGSGAMGMAYLVRRKSDGLLLVMKQISLMGMSEEDKLKAMQEVDCLRSLRHRNITALYDAFINEEEALCIIMEYADGGDLAMFIKESKTKPKEEKILDIFAQICRDIKCANILLTKEGVVKLADFGVARVLSAQSNFARTCIGTPVYLSPEICEGRAYDDKADVWSLGCVLYELITLTQAFAAPSLPALIMKIVQGKYAPIPPSAASPYLLSLVTAMLSLDPARRPAVADILSAPQLQPHLPPPPPVPAPAAAGVAAATSAAADAAPAAAAGGASAAAGACGAADGASAAPARSAPPPAAPHGGGHAAGVSPKYAARPDSAKPPLAAGGGGRHAHGPPYGAAAAAGNPARSPAAAAAGSAAAAAAGSPGQALRARRQQSAHPSNGRRSVAGTAAGASSPSAAAHSPHGELGRRGSAAAAAPSPAGGERGRAAVTHKMDGGAGVEKERRRVTTQQAERREVMALPDQVPNDEADAAERRLARLLRI